MGRAGLNEVRGLRGAIIEWEFVPLFEYLFEGVLKRITSKTFVAGFSVNHCSFLCHATIVVGGKRRT